MKKAVKASGKRGASRGSSSTSGTKPQPRAARPAGQSRFAESSVDNARQTNNRQIG